MVRDEKISLFYRQYDEEFREIIDYLSGLVFEFFPTIKEEIKEDSLKYISPKIGSLFLIEVKDNRVYFCISKKKLLKKENISNSHFLEENKQYYYYSYDTYKKINRDNLISVITSIK